MASFKFVQSHGFTFAAKVRDLLGSQVVQPPRNNFRLTPTSVSLCLQAILGGPASGFHVSHLGHQVFKFHVSSKHVGFLCLDLKDLSCDGFHVGFFFNNSSGLAQAYSFAKKDSGPAYRWELVRPRKGKAVSLISDKSILKSDNLWNVEFKNSVSYGKMNQALSGHRYYGSSSQAAKVFHDDSSPSLAPKAYRSSGFSRSYVDAVKMNLDNVTPLSGANLVPLGCRSIHHNSASLGGASLNSDRSSFLASKKVRPSVFQRLVFPNSNQSRLLDNRPVKGHTRNDCKPYHDLQGFIKRCGDSFGCAFSPCLSAGDWPSNCHLTWFKAGPSSGQRPNSSAQPPAPLSSIATVAPALTPSSSLAPMAFLNIDPQPMMLAGFNRVIVQGRQQFARVIFPRATPRNENLAIVTVINLPPGEILFGPLRNVILQFLEHDLGLEVLDIQRCPFGRGQAYVRMGRPSDKDALITQSPHFRNGFAFSFVQHNRAANARRVTFNRECWLMLIGFPLDSCSVHEIEDAIRSFGRMILWQKDNVLARIIIKARVTELIDIPHYLILSEGDDFEGVSFTVQCEILQQNLLGGFLQDEDIPPGGPDDNFAPIQEDVVLGQNVAQEGHMFVNLNINMVLTQDQQVHLNHLPKNITDRMSSLLPDCLSTPKDFNMEKQRPGQNPNIFRLWAQHFSRVGCPEQVTQIPSDWAAFFINMLMSPEHFDWAKQFLASKTWEFLLSCSNSTAMMAFAIPLKYPSSSPFICSLSQEEVGTSTPGFSKAAEAELKVARSHKRARIRLGTKAAPECESSVRRSDRIKAKNKGFRRSSCQDNTCLACNACPPTISAEVIQSLGSKVCALDRTKIYPGNLSLNSGSQKPIGRTMARRSSEALSKGKEVLSEVPSNSSTGA
uniref:DUF7597 domain-containing protein n=1 Tax=Setaria viridis TaxID=4556 RepID=A0A4U6THT2_SETVI|nr:hypothetical protein SEVIR_8G109100v2 [Setaria viridis]